SGGAAGGYGPNAASPRNERNRQGRRSHIQSSRNVGGFAAAGLLGAFGRRGKNRAGPNAARFAAEKEIGGSPTGGHLGPRAPRCTRTSVRSLEHRPSRGP